MGTVRTWQGIERRCRALVPGTTSGDLVLATNNSGWDMITDWPRTPTWTWKLKIKFDRRQKTEGKEANDKRLDTNDNDSTLCVRDHDIGLQTKEHSTRQLTNDNSKGKQYSDHDTGLKTKEHDSERELPDKDKCKLQTDQQDTHHKYKRQVDTQDKRHGDQQNCNEKKLKHKRLTYLMLINKTQEERNKIETGAQIYRYHPKD